MVFQIFRHNQCHEASLFPCRKKHWRIVISKEEKTSSRIYVNNYPDTQIFDGKGLAVGGSHQINEFDPSAIVILWRRLGGDYAEPSAIGRSSSEHQVSETALMRNWEEKIEKMARETASENVTNIAGVPTWTVLLIQKIVEQEKKRYS